MNATLVAGGLPEAEDVEIIEIALPGTRRATLRYPRPEPTDGSYPVPLFSARLSATVRRSESGWIARVTDLDEIGHGATWKSALDNLRDSVEQYLEFLRDDKPKLAPVIAHHTDYIELLDTPRDLWFASVEIDAPTVE
jgi:predicted RNase H-like HicB family nuclease